MQLTNPIHPHAFPILMPSPLASTPGRPRPEDAGRRVRHGLQHQVAGQQALGPLGHHVGAAAAQALHAGGCSFGLASAAAFGLGGVFRTRTAAAVCTRPGQPPPERRPVNQHAHSNPPTPLPTPQVPPNGLVLYTGTILTDEGKEKKVNIDFEPFKPINTSLYLCDNKFHTEALAELLESDNR
jgi:hypothetical protein